MDDMMLIEEVRRQPELYDHTHENFKNKEFRHMIWNQISYRLLQDSDDISVRRVRNRWKSLRDSYVKNRKNQNFLIHGNDAKLKRNWKYTEAMSFLAPYVNAHNYNTFEPCQVTETEEIEPAEKFFVTIEDLRGAPEGFVGGNELLTVSPDGFQQNDIDSFFQGVADTVKRLSPANQVKLQKDIVNLVLDAKLTEIESVKDTLNAS